MNAVRKTDAFEAWFTGLRDVQAQARINIRITRLEMGNPGDWKSVGGGVSELRIDYGPGYRVYYTVKSRTVYLLLIGGDKSTQQRDIEIAQAMAKDIEE